MKSIKLLIFCLIVSISFIGFTQSKFSSSVSIVGNNVSSGTWEEESLSPTPTVTPEPEVLGISTGDVVINEVMWMGSTDSGVDEWIELRNMTGQDIDISGWKIENALSSSGTLEIEEDSIILANGYFVIARYPSGGNNSALNIIPNMYPVGSLSLVDSSNGHLILKDLEENIIDQAKGDTWPAGVHGGSGGVRQSMQRKNIPGDGLLPENWYTCEAVGCNSGDYWKVDGGDNYGTPGAANI